ncbi:Mucin-13 [Pteropus alecto]|uniref:Mucin-13 n=1 Tax=Pteropus alecto TaxID=9402 RepID=L5L389_PTEAL|nr:Mucin-13 [Pteropus alecto]
MPIFCIDLGTFKEEKYVASESVDSNSSARLNLPTVPPCLTFLAILHHPVHFTSTASKDSNIMAQSDNSAAANNSATMTTPISTIVSATNTSNITSNPVTSSSVMSTKYQSTAIIQTTVITANTSSSSNDSSTTVPSVTTQSNDVSSSITVTISDSPGTVPSVTFSSVTSSKTSNPNPDNTTGCEEDSCSGGASCVSLNNTSFCLCVDGYYYNSSTCNKETTKEDETSVSATIDNAIKGNSVGITKYDGKSLCDFYGCVEADEKDDCSDGLLCTCKEGLERPNPQIALCVDFQLILIIVGIVAGGLILAMMIALFLVRQPVERQISPFLCSTPPPPPPAQTLKRLDGFLKP